MTYLAWLLLGVWAVASAGRRCRRRPRRGVTIATRRDLTRWWVPALRWRRSGGSALPEAVDAIAAALRAGRSLEDGIALAASEAPPALALELDALVTTIRRGLPAHVAVDRWAATTAEPGAALMAAAVGLAGLAGGDPARALAGVADTLRERRALGREIRALSAQARLSAVIVAVAPIGFAAVAALTDPDTARFLLATPAGLACIVAGLGLDLTGWRWMLRITRQVR